MNFIYLIILLPLISFLVLSISQNRFPKILTSYIGISSIFFSFLLTIYAIYDFSFSKNIIFHQHFWNWIILEKNTIDISISLDGLSLVMISIISVVGLLVHIFIIWYIKEDKNNYSRFFAYTNLFIASMFLLVLSNNFILMYLGWEGVGICSYLLIGFYYKKKENCNAAFKAFLVTKFSDLLLLFAIFLIWDKFHTLNFYDLQNQLKNIYTKDYNFNLIGLMLLGGAIGKSAQIPLHIWLPSAMLGPTPVSALIHSATMVTSGVYLIARNYYLFELTPAILNLISFIGITTLLLSSIAALIQKDIKKILAYSTISQLGYMFVALGVKDWYGAILHLMSHAFFKALFFLSSAVVISLFKEQNIFKIGKDVNIKKSIPLIYICFLFAGLSISSFPLITSGFFSKERILYSLLNKNYIFLISVLIGSFITTLYIFRMIFVLFHSNLKESIILFSSKHKSFAKKFPLLCLLLLSSFLISIIPLPLKDVFHIYENKTIENAHLSLMIISFLFNLLAISLAYLIWIKPTYFIKQIKSNEKINFVFYKFCSSIEWIFESIYNFCFIQPYLFFSKILKNDPVDKITSFFYFLFDFFNKVFTYFSYGNNSYYINILFFSITILLITILI